MTNEQMNIAIAEACGKLVYRYSYLTPYHDQQIQKRFFYDMGHAEIAWATDSKYGGCSPIETEIDLDIILDYTGDLNAMHEAEQVVAHKLDTYFAQLIAIRWRDAQSDRHPRNFSPASATAPQRAEAFLRTIEKWEE